MYMEGKGRVVAFGFSAHNLAMMGWELSLLWPEKRFVPCMNAVELAGMDPGAETGGMSLLVNLSREFHELDSAVRTADGRGMPVIGAVATDFVNVYSLRLCMEREMPAIIGEMSGREELGEARDAIRAGRRFVSRSILRGGGYRFVDPPVCMSLLSDNEALCVGGRLGGLSVSELSAILGAGASTVRTYVNRAFSKLGVSTAEELAWLIAGRPMGCYHGIRGGRKKAAFSSRRLFPETKKPEQAGA